jgi:hypothetical protein
MFQPQGKESHCFPLAAKQLLALFLQLPQLAEHWQ